MTSAESTLRGPIRAVLLAGISALAVSVSGSGAGASTFLLPGSLLISTTTYSDAGAVSNLVANSSKLPGSKAGKTSTAVSGGNYATVFNNASVDGSFGVTSPITLQDINVTTSPGSVNGTLAINPNVVSTSFSSKSELGLNIAKTSSGLVATFMGYAGGGVGNLDVSNSDTTAYKDTTNPVTSFFAPGSNQTYAFNRTVVAVGANGNVSTTQTLAYGGNNGRAAVLAPNGLYYTVGNSNNGSGTPTQLTTSTGLEVVTPGSTPNSTMVDPSFQSIPGDKAGKDNNFRGLTLYNGNLYFTKGSGSNGIDTVYTVSNPGGQLPTTTTANSASISILPGFPTGSAKAGPDYTPFGLFFANRDTLYVADEGSGDATDTSLHAGLEKWSLIKGTWKLDYILQDDLIGTQYTPKGTNSGISGSWPTVTTVGLRNLAGRVNKDGTVTLWATTSTSSASGDNGADPNEIVQITDVLSDKTLPNETFSVLDGPEYGLRYGGVAFAATTPLPSAWTMMLIGLVGLGFVGFRRRRGSALPAAA
ncbi:MAG TPA: PEP-CTERM sorting domain-containing protein [Xanthobacteraceae bacterium]|nr:PEP-CTERM sorting domain-containing protein [Xanthobacteraceae bacterium]